MLFSEKKREESLGPHIVPKFKWSHDNNAKQRFYIHTNIDHVPTKASPPISNVQKNLSTFTFGNNSVNFILEIIQRNKQQSFFITL